MYEYVEGKLDKVNPAFAIIDCGGVGYHVQISLHTYEKIKSLSVVRLLIHFAVREDGHFLYGFAEESERHLFRLLISVNGVGSATARMILSSQAPNDLINALATGNQLLLKSIKGVGPKTAQRMIVELQDKVGKLGNSEFDTLGSQKSDKDLTEAVMALQALGFSKASAEKAILKVTDNKSNSLPVEELIKKSLRFL